MHGDFKRPLNGLCSYERLMLEAVLSRVPGFVSNGGRRSFHGTLNHERDAAPHNAGLGSSENGLPDDDIELSLALFSFNGI
jgi:hypothetical protein